MTAWRERWLPLAVLVAAVAALVGSLTWTTSMGWFRGDGLWRSGAAAQCAGPMMGAADPGTGPVRSLTGAERAAQRYADTWGLHVGEVMRFSNGYYAELIDASGGGATEVLIDPDTAAVWLECGPAMMWNTRYGMMRAGSRARPATIEPARARRVANRWLRDNATGLTAGDAEGFPGYYTLHTLDQDKIVGMLSVNASTGAVWYHTWHGRFIAMRESSGPGQ